MNIKISRATVGFSLKVNVRKGKKRVKKSVVYDLQLEFFKHAAMADSALSSKVIIVNTCVSQKRVKGYISIILFIIVFNIKECLFVVLLQGLLILFYFVSFLLFLNNSIQVVVIKTHLQKKIT